MMSVIANQDSFIITKNLLPVKEKHALCSSDKVSGALGCSARLPLPGVSTSCQERGRALGTWGQCRLGDGQNDETVALA